MSVNEIADPRLQLSLGEQGHDNSGVRPVFTLPRRGVTTSAIAIGAALMALLLFTVLNSRRSYRAEQSNDNPVATPAIQFDAPPLYIPPAAMPVAPLTPAEPVRPGQASTVPAPSELRPTRVTTAPAPIPTTQNILSAAPTIPPRTSAGSALVMDGGAVGTSEPTAGAPDSPRNTLKGSAVGRMRASAFANRSMTVPQGYLIHAVLETGFDSTKPGFARAVVSKDVRGFDGTLALIPRGSRLIGEYRADVTQSQKRVMIIWTRLIRPDGMTIALDSPAVDTVGRGGVEASVSTHFFQRLGDALLQSTFEVGRLFAGRAINKPIIVVSGNPSSAAVDQIGPFANYAPTLKIRPGRSFSVFVAHDLDFSAAGASK